MGYNLVIPPKFIGSTTHSSGTLGSFSIGVTIFDVLAGMSLFAVAVVGTATTTGWSVTDTTTGGPNTWTNDLAPVSIGGSTCMGIWRCSPVTHDFVAINSPSVSFTIPTSTFFCAQVWAVNQATTVGLDLNTSATGTSTAPASGTTGTAARANEVVYGFIAQNLGPASGDSVTETLTSPTGVASTGTLMLHTNANGGSGSSARTVGLWVYYQVVGAPATYSVGGTLGHSSNWMARTMSYTMAPPTAITAPQQGVKRASFY